MGNEKDARAELALFKRDPDAYVAQAQASRPVGEDTTKNAPLLIDLPLVEKFLDDLKREGRTERHRKNVAPSASRISRGSHARAQGAPAREGDA